MLISELAESAGVHPCTIRRLEKRGVIPVATRDVNGWRRYPAEAVTALRKLYGEEKTPQLPHDSQEGHGA